MESKGEGLKGEEGEGRASGLSPQAAATLDKLTSSSTSSLVQTLGLSGEDEVSLQKLLKKLQVEIMASLEELTVITTHDDNLERQYKEVVSENTKLHSQLEKARNEIRHLRGQLSILQMTSAEAREQKAKAQLRIRRRTEHERGIEEDRSKGQLEVRVLTAAERAMTVNSKGQYVDHRSLSRHLRSSTFPGPQPLPSLSPVGKSPPRREAAVDVLPPPLAGCQCSECNSKQSLGALTLGKSTLCQRHLTNQLTKSGQQVLLGDKVVVKGERLGTVAYIGKLDFDIFEQIYVGVCLDMPVGNSNGTLKGRRYFQCHTNHGVFVKPTDVICVTGRKPLIGGTAVPRVREKVPSASLKWQSQQKPSSDGVSQQSLTSAGAASNRSESSVMRAKAITQAELEALKHKKLQQVEGDSVRQMAERIQVLAQKQKAHDQATAERTPATPTPEPQAISPQPLPPIAETAATPKEATPPVSTPLRPLTPLEKTLFELLSDADLGATGFLKVNELKSVLLKLGKQLSPEEVTELLSTVGVDVTDDAVGLPYHQLLPHLLIPLQQY